MYVYYVITLYTHVGLLLITEIAVFVAFTSAEIAQHRRENQYPSVGCRVQDEYTTVVLLLPNKYYIQSLCTWDHDNGPSTIG